MIKKQPIIFADGPEDDFVVGEQTMDLLLHYAQSGMVETELLMKNDPSSFSEQEVMDFVANKVALAKAPDILQDYKKKVREFEMMQEKIQAIVSKCETVFSNYNVRKNEISAQKEPATIRYSPDGEMVISPAIKTPKRRINITLPKPDRE